MQEAENFHGPTSRDKGRNVPMVQMQVHNRNCNNLTIEGNVVPPGQQTITVYKDVVPKVLAMVETASDTMAGAQRHFMLKVAEEVKGRITYAGDVASLADILQSGKNLPDATATAYKSVLETTPRSLYASFAEVNGRGMKPLVSAVVVEGSEHPDHHMVTKQEEAKLLHGVIAGAQQPAPVAAMPSMAAIEAMIADRVQSELKRLADQGAAQAEAKAKKG